MRRLPKLARYTAVSAISSSISWTILGVLVLTGVTTAGWANVVATAAGTIPSFELNRRWVWGKRGTRSVLAEVGPFTILSFTGLALSTVAVSGAAGWASADGLGPAARAVAAEAASIATFGTLWVAQYLLLDRVLFASAAHGARRAPAGAPAAGGPSAPAGAGSGSAGRDSLPAAA